MKRRLLVILLLLHLAALACNLPTARPPAAARPQGPALQQTISALETEAAPPGSRPNPAATPPVLPTQPNAQPAVPPAATQPLPIAPAPTIIPGVGGHGVMIPGAPLRVNGQIQYSAQPGDTLEGLAGRFDVDMGQIAGTQQMIPHALLPAGELLVIPDTLGEVGYAQGLLPDSEVVYSPSTVDFSIANTIEQAGGFLSTYSERVDQETLTGAQIVERVAQETSINPRLLLGILEYRSHWVFGQMSNPQPSQYPIGFYASQYSGLYKELVLTARQLTLGYYGWRSGKTVEVEFVDQSRLRISPTVNAGSMALAYTFSKLYKRANWEQELYSPARFLTFYQEQFGSPWERAARVEPLLPDDFSQPTLELPFQPGEKWSFTGGPHLAWGVGSPWGGLDFAPSSGEAGCTVSRFWATAAAPGLVLRVGQGVVMIDLDGDGNEQTGWVLMYLHVAARDRITPGTQVNTNDLIGHPSCEGGFSTGTHVHISRKYNGEWQAVDGPAPFVLSGWQARPGLKPYSGTLTKDDLIVTARPDGSHTSSITR